VSTSEPRITACAKWSPFGLEVNGTVISLSNSLFDFLFRAFRKLNCERTKNGYFRLNCEKIAS